MRAGKETCSRSCLSKFASSWVAQHQRQARANEPWAHERAHRARTVRRRPTAAPKLRPCVMPFLRTAMVCARIAIPAANEPTRSPALTCYRTGRHRPRQWSSLLLCLLPLHLSLLLSCCTALHLPHPLFVCIEHRHRLKPGLQSSLSALVISSNSRGSLPTPRFTYHPPTAIVPEPASLSNQVTLHRGIWRAADSERCFLTLIITTAAAEKGFLRHISTTHSLTLDSGIYWHYWALHGLRCDRSRKPVVDSVRLPGLHAQRDRISRHREAFVTTSQ